MLRDEYDQVREKCERNRGNCWLKIFLLAVAILAVLLIPHNALGWGPGPGGWLVEGPESEIYYHQSAYSNGGESWDLEIYLL